MPAGRTGESQHPVASLYPSRRGWPVSVVSSLTMKIAEGCFQAGLAMIVFTACRTKASPFCFKATSFGSS